MSEATTSAAQKQLRRARLFGPLVIVPLCLWLLSRQLDAFSFESLMISLSLVDPINWALAIMATTVSFWAIGRYDRVAHNHLKTGILPGHAWRNGMAAIAFSQAAGFGLATGAFARWRLTPGLSPLTALKLTVFVGISFMGALMVLIALAELMIRPDPAMILAGLAALSVAVGIMALALLCPTLALGRFRIRLPSLPALGAIAGWALVDTAAAAAALYLLLPAEAELAWGAVYAAYLIALGAALVSGAPGGVGPLDLALIALLPDADAGAVVSGLVAFRLVYFALPAAIAGLYLLFPPQDRQNCPATARRDCLLPQDRPRSETGVIRQNGGYVLRAGGASFAVVETPQVSVALFDPMSGRARLLLASLKRSAEVGNRVACLYKCGARTALEARQAGWRVVRIAREAVIDPTRFDTASPSHRQLRRKLRHAEKAGISLVGAPQTVPFDALGQIDAAWQAARGEAYGFSMGRFSPDYLRWQRLYIAYLGNAPCAFISLHAAREEWCLDLIRAVPDIPDGTMHALVVAAIEDARRAGLRRISLAAIPDYTLPGQDHGGLARFKASFAPRWEPRYMAAPTWLALALAMADLALCIRRPRPVESPDHRMAHQDDEENEIALPGCT